jgi:NAD(P)H-flavin reductase
MTPGWKAEGKPAAWGAMDRQSRLVGMLQLGRWLAATYYSGLDAVTRFQGALRVSGSSYMADHFQLRLVDSSMLAPTVRHLVFERADGQPLAFQPGQFLQVHFHYDDGTATKRSYSVGTVGDGFSPVAAHRNRGELCRRRRRHQAAGRAAARRHHRCERPVRPFLPAGGRPSSALPADRHRHRRHPVPRDVAADRKLIAAGDREVVLLYGARNEGELLYGEEFEAFAQQHPASIFHPCLSREPRAKRAEPASPRPQRPRANVLAELGSPTPSSDIAYLCGNPNMVDAAFAALKEFGLPVPQIRREKYILL